MIDFHTHILPGIDDGSQDIRTTEEMLEEEKRQGVTLICATPHFYAHRMSFDEFLENRKAAADMTAELLCSRPELPDILTGAEVYYFQGIGKASRTKELCVTGTDTILVEMPFAQWNEDVLRDMEALIYKQHLDVVVAHIERYYEFQKNKNIWDAVFDLPLTRQVNAGSFLKGWSRSRFVTKVLKAHPDTLVGTDCHNMDSRRPNLEDARSVISKKLGAGAMDESDEHLKKLLSGATDVHGSTWTY